MNIDELKQLIAVISASAVQEFEMERNGVKVRIVKAGAPAQLITSVVPAQAAAPAAPVVAVEPAVLAAQAAAVAAAAAPAAPAAAPVAEGKPFDSPMVGTFYRSAAPGAAPFVKVGDRISAGQVICIIEAMKIMNEIEAEFSGEVTEVCVENGKPVEFGETLFRIKAD